MGHPRDRHCKLAKFNGSGRCIACCTYNQRNLYREDCTGMKAVDDWHQDDGREVPIMRARRIKSNG